MADISVQLSCFPKDIKDSQCIYKSCRLNDREYRTSKVRENNCQPLWNDDMEKLLDSGISKGLSRLQLTFLDGIVCTSEHLAARRP